MALTSMSDSPSTDATAASGQEQTVRVRREFTIGTKHLVGFFGSYAIVVAAFVALAATALGVR